MNISLLTIMALVSVERFLMAYWNVAKPTSLVIGAFNFMDGTKKCFDSHIKDPDQHVDFFLNSSYQKAKCSMPVYDDLPFDGLTWPNVIIASVFKGCYYGFQFPRFFWNVGKDLQREDWDNRIAEYYTFSYRYYKKC
jgi:hypothetical protein